MSSLGKHDDAIACYDKAIANASLTSEVWRFRGGSTKGIVGAIPADMVAVKAWNGRGLALKAIGKLAKAVNSYDKALEIDPRDATSWFNKASALAEWEKYQEAMICFQKAQGLGDPNASRYAEQCKSLLPPHADDSVTTPMPVNCVQELCDRAADLASSGMHAEAVACYETALRLDSSSAHIWFNMAHSIGHLGRHHDVVKSCERALTIHPTFSPLWILKGLGFMSMEQFNEAMACFQESENLGDTSAGGHMARCRIAQADWYFRLGSRYQQEGNSTQANACYEKGLALDASKAVIWVNKGAALLALRRAAEAVACFDRAIKLNPRDPDAWNNRGIALMSLGKQSDALVCIKEAKRLGASVAG